MSDVTEARNALKEKNASVVFCKEGELLIEFGRGISPLIKMAERNKNLKGYSAADKIIGKAAALLMVLLGIKHVYAEVISQEGCKVLSENNIPYRYEILTDKIINRKGDGTCPMETAVVDIEDPAMAYTIIKEKLLSLQTNTEVSG